MDYDLGFATLVSASSLMDVEYMSSSFSSFTPLAFDPTQILNINSIGSGEIFDGFMQELRLTGNIGATDWTVGVFYNDSSRDTTTDATIGYRNDTIELYRLPSSSEKLSTKSISYFGDFSYLVSDSFSLSVGTRYFEDKQTSFAFLNKHT